jgi:ATP-dependent helicase/nuclease subunit B
MNLLRAAAADGAADTRLEWLKAWPPARPRPLAALESAWRSGRPPNDEAAALWAAAEAHLVPFNARRERPLSDWLALLAERLAADGSTDALLADPAGEQVLRALRLDADDVASAAWRHAADALPLDLAGFTAWVDATLEAAQFLPLPGPTAEVVLTPLARAIGRPFAQVVVPGADHSHLGAIEPPAALIGERLADTLGLDNAARRRLRQRLAFGQLLRAPGVSLLRRRLDGDEPLAASPEVEALALTQAQAGQPLPAERDWQPALQAVLPTPLARPAPVAANDLPPKLSASTVEALRQCPYRFFARAVLRVTEPEELDAELAKRDYGTWLHAVLHRFHRQRDGDAAAALAAAADAVTREQQVEPAELLPYRASFEIFAPAYLAWLAQREAAGWVWQDGEFDRAVAPPEQTLQGRLDRLDHGPGGALQLIDYKTGSVQALKNKVAEPLEDTQLAFYGALVPGVESALYLALDDAKAPLEIEHAGVAETAVVLVGQLSGEMARLRQGAGLPALGEGAVCDTCEARGLCRRDHWSVA